MLYGAVLIHKAVCPDCRREALILADKMSCCGLAVEPVAPHAYKRESEPPIRRRRPSLKRRTQQLEEQEHRCFYCQRTFGSYIWRKNKLVKLMIHWDHQVPWSYSRDNLPDNFVAACHLCNGFKSDKCFSTVEEARIFIAQAWEASAVEDL